MNDVQHLFDRQLGICSRLNYDNVLKRLVAFSGESYYGLHSSNFGSPRSDQDPPIFACRFAEIAGFEHVLALANEDGKVAIQSITRAESVRNLENIQCHNNAVFDLAWIPGRLNFVTVSGDHTACVWDVSESGVRRSVVCAAHTRSVKTVACCPRAQNVFATGGRDGHVLVWDVRAGASPALRLRPDNWLASCHAGSAAGPANKRARLDAPRAVSVTGLAFRDDFTLLSCGECDGNIKVWDLRKNYSAYKREPLPKHAIPYCGSSARNGYTNLVVDSARTRLYASCMDNVIYCFNIATCSVRPERRYLGHENGTFYIKTGLSADGRYLVSGSSDKHAYVWNLRNAAPLVRLTGHHAEVTCAAWAPRGMALVTCGDDARHMIWRVGPEDRERWSLCGWSEPAPPLEPAPVAWGTPTAPRRRTPGASTPGERGRTAPAARSSKRCLAAMLDAARDAPDEQAKRQRLESEERSAAAAGVKRRNLDTIDEGPATAVKRPRAETPPPRPESPQPEPQQPEPQPGQYTPKKRPSPRKNETTPRKVRVVAFSTPTQDLPDWVATGEAPHLRLMSPPRRKPDAPDWLTLLARARRQAAPPAPHSPKENVPPRRNSTTEKTPKSAKKNRTLLKYFTVANKET